MSYYKDLSRWPDGGLGNRALAVGWLHPAHEYSNGSVDVEFFKRLVDMLLSPWQPHAVAGRHRCPFCRFTGGPAQLSFDGSVIAVGASILVVPTKEAIFVAPSMIAHYVDAHDYAPPSAFMQAVTQCPEMRSMPYFRLLRAHGVTTR